MRRSSRRIPTPQALISQDAQEYFTVTDISNMLGMAKEEKTMSRVLSELRKIHSKQISQINVRKGKIFLYYYFIDKRGQIEDSDVTVNDNWGDTLGEGNTKSREDRRTARRDVSQQPHKRMTARQAALQK